MINLPQIRDSVIIPALTAIGHVEPSAVRLVLGTGLVESNYQFLMQQNGGPALSYWQIEPVTANSLWDNFLPSHPEVLSGLESLMTSADRIVQLVTNDGYAAAMCRIKYLSIPSPLPHVDDLEGMADYWVRYYNAGGSGTVERFMNVANQNNLMSL